MIFWRWSPRRSGKFSYNIVKATTILIRRGGAWHITDRINRRSNNRLKIYIRRLRFAHKLTTRSIYTLYYFSNITASMIYGIDFNVYIIKKQQVYRSGWSFGIEHMQIFTVRHYVTFYYCHYHCAWLFTLWVFLYICLLMPASCYPCSSKLCGLHDEDHLLSVVSVIIPMNLYDIDFVRLDVI